MTGIYNWLQLSIYSYTYPPAMTERPANIQPSDPSCQPLAKLGRKKAREKAREKGREEKKPAVAITLFFFFYCRAHVQRQCQTLDAAIAVAAKDEENQPVPVNTMLPKSHTPLHSLGKQKQQ